MNKYAILHTLVLRLRLQELNKLKERALCILGYCKNVKNIVDLSSALFTNTNLCTGYLEYPKQQRKLKPSSFKTYNCCYFPNLRISLFQDLPCIKVNSGLKYCGDTHFHKGIPYLSD